MLISDGKISFLFPLEALTTQNRYDSIIELSAEACGSWSRGNEEERGFLAEAEGRPSGKITAAQELENGTQKKEARDSCYRSNSLRFRARQTIMFVS